MKQSQQPYQTYPIDSGVESRHQRVISNRPRGNSKGQLLSGQHDIPLMPVMPPEYASQGQFHQISLQQSKAHQDHQYSSPNRNEAGIPLLELAEDPGHTHKMKKKNKNSKR